MRIPIYLVAGIAVSAFGISQSNAAMLLTQDPQTGQKVIVDTDDPNYREQVIEGQGGTHAPESLPEGAWLLTEDEAGHKMVVNPATGHTYGLRLPNEGTEATVDIPEGALILDQSPTTGQPQR